MHPRSLAPRLASDFFGSRLQAFLLPFCREDYVDILKLLYDILVKIRKSGMLAIEADLEAPEKSKLFSEYPRILADHHFIEFTTDCLRLMVGGNLDPHELESLLEYELENHHKESTEPSHALQQVGDSLPGFGIVAAVLGIVNTMGALEGADTATIGHKVADSVVILGAIDIVLGEVDR